MLFLSAATPNQAAQQRQTHSRQNLFVQRLIEQHENVLIDSAFEKTKQRQPEHTPKKNELAKLFVIFHSSPSFESGWPGGRKSSSKNKAERH